MEPMNVSSVLKTKSVRIFLVWAVVFGLLAAAATVAQMVLLGEVVGRVLLASAGPAEVGGMLVLLLGVVILRPVFVWLREVIALRVAESARRRVRERLLEHLLALGPAYHGGERTGELVTTAVEGVERLEAYFARYLPQMYLSALVPVLIAGCVLWLDPCKRYRVARHRPCDTGSHGPNRTPRREAHPLVMDGPLPDGCTLPGHASGPHHAQNFRPLRNRTRTGGPDQRRVRPPDDGRAARRLSLGPRPGVHRDGLGGTGSRAAGCLPAVR